MTLTSPFSTPSTNTITGVRTRRSGRRLTEPEKTVYRIRDVDAAISTTVAGIVRSEIGRMELDQVQANRSSLIGAVKSHLEFRVFLNGNRTVVFEYALQTVSRLIASGAPCT